MHRAIILCLAERPDTCCQRRCVGFYHGRCASKACLYGFCIVEQEATQNDGGELLQIQCALPAVVRRTAFLRIGFDDTLAFKQWLVGTLYQIEQLFNYTF